MADQESKKIEFRGWGEGWGRGLRARARKIIMIIDYNKGHITIIRIEPRVASGPTFGNGRPHRGLLARSEPGRGR